MIPDRHASPDRTGLASASLVNGAVNAVINGLIQLVLLRGKGPIALSADAIGSTEHTVLGTAVPLAVSLAMILTAISQFTQKPPRHPFFPTVAWLIVKHGLLAFGAVVAGAILWQRLAGTVVVSPVVAAVILGLIAGLVAAFVNYLTVQATRLEKP